MKKDTEETDEYTKSAIRHLLHVIERTGLEGHLTGDADLRPGIQDTPSRVLKSFQELYAGYTTDIPGLFTTFEPEGYQDVVLLKDVEMYSTCEHHMLPFVGKAHIAYIPNKKIVGISKLARVLEAFARRLQIQERIGMQICDALEKYLEPKAVGVVIEAQHFCMCARGVGKQHSSMTTSCMRGVFLEEPEARAELMQLIKD